MSQKKISKDASIVIPYRGGGKRGDTTGMPNQSVTLTRGFIYLLLASLCSSVISIAAKIGLRNDTSPLEVVVSRLVLAALVLWLYFVCFRPKVLRIDTAGIIRCVQAALVNCVSMYCYVLALSYMDVSLTIMVYTTAHIPVVMLFLRLRGERPNRLDYFRFLLALLGVYLFVGLLGPVNIIGVGLVMASALFFGIHISLIQLRLGDYDPPTVTLYVITSMAVILSSIYLASGYRWPHFDTATWEAMLWIAIVGTAMARLLLFAGIQKAGSRQAALISPLETPLAVLLAVWLLGEWLTLPQWLGTSLVVASVALGAKAK